MSTIKLIEITTQSVLQDPDALSGIFFGLFILAMSLLIIRIEENKKLKQKIKELKLY